jgi:hypothetical protein
MLRNPAKAMMVAAALLAAGPALAQRYGYAGGSDLRLMVGGTSFSPGYYCGGGFCDYTPFGYGAFTLGADYDMPFGRVPHLTLGARLMFAGPAYYSSQIFIEPLLGVTWKFGGYRAPVEPRLHLGLGIYAGSAFGAVLRFGGGLGFALSPRVGLGLDLVIEAGAIHGYGVSTVQFTIGPEFRL